MKRIFISFLLAVATGIGSYSYGQANKEESKDPIVDIKITIKCTSIKGLEESLIANGYKILMTGFVPNEKLEVVETWVNPKTKAFVILRLVPELNASCVISNGPKMVPGGETIEQQEQKQDEKPGEVKAGFIKV